MIYGVEHYKVHSKLMVLTYRKHNKIQYITQIGTGNYNEKTANLYTDLSLITAHEKIGREAVEVFKNLSLGKFIADTHYLLVAPKCMKQPLMELIDKEIHYAKKGAAACILIKVNSLSHKELIDKLIEASQAGVEITLLVRGICCLQAGIPGISDHITIHSIVGRYLEHSRIYSFGEGKRQQMYIGSADWMSRNMDYRIEVAVEILDHNVKKTLNQMLQLYLSDNKKLRTMDEHGHYCRAERMEQEAVVDSQIQLFSYFEKKAQKVQNKKTTQKREQKKRNNHKKIANDKKEKERKKVKEKQKKEQYGFIRKKDKRKK